MGGEMEGVPGGAVSRWKMGQGAQVELQEWRSLGSGYPAHLVVSREHSLAYTANYGGNSFSMLSLGSEGELGELMEVLEFPEEGELCRDASHPHQTVVKGEWVWLVDLGCDRIRHYRRTDDGLTKVMTTEVKEGAGPRHLVIHPSLPLAFLVCELQSLVIAYNLDMETSTLTKLQEVMLSSDNGDFGAEILVQGDFLYTTSRGTGVLIVYQIGSMGWLERIQEVHLGGTWPRSLAIMGSLGAVIDQKGDTLQLLHVDEDTGLVTPGMELSTPSQPAFVQFIP